MSNLLRKVRLRRAIDRRNRPRPRTDHYSEQFNVASAPPYVESSSATRAHRIRDGTIYCVHHTGLSHIAWHCWCGQVVLQSSPQKRSNKKVTLTDSPTMPICATCEGRAIGAGEETSNTINGREVIFSPRRNNK